MKYPIVSLCAKLSGPRKTYVTREYGPQHQMSLAPLACTISRQEYKEQTQFAMFVLDALI